MAYHAGMPWHDRCKLARRRHVLALLAALVVWYWSSEGRADTVATVLDDAPLHIKSSSTLTTAKGTVVELPPAYVLSESQWITLDLTVKNLQDIKTRIEAENASLKESAKGWQPGWRVLLLTLGTGLAAGIYIDHRWF